MQKRTLVRKLEVRTRFNREHRRVGTWIRGRSASRTPVTPTAAGSATATGTPTCPVPPSTPASDADTLAVAAEIEELMAALEQSTSPFRPTSFWAPAVRQLTAELRLKGIHTFKSWHSAQDFFYPRYGQGFTMAHLEPISKFAVEANPTGTVPWVTTRLSGSIDAHRDIDVALAMLNRSCFDIDLLAHGESAFGRPPQRFRLAGADGPTFGRPYLNYAKILASVSTVVETPPRSVLELGGGFGVFGELLRQIRRDSVYVDVDIPPLTSIAGWYLHQVVTDVPVLGPSDPLPDINDPAWTNGFAAALPSWRLPDCPPGHFDLFINAFSFQEMEPEVVAAYADLVAAIAPRYVVSQNSRQGKPLASAECEVGVTRQTTSDMIVAEFERNGYVVAGRFGRPSCPPQAELVVLRRD